MRGKKRERNNENDSPNYYSENVFKWYKKMEMQLISCKFQGVPAFPAWLTCLVTQPVNRPLGIVSVSNEGTNIINLPLVYLFSLSQVHSSI